MQEHNNGLGLTKDERELISLADEMASAMAGMNSQTYDTFVLAREKLRYKIKQMVDKQHESEDRIVRLKQTVASI